MSASRYILSIISMSFLIFVILWLGFDGMALAQDEGGPPLEADPPAYLTFELQAGSEFPLSIGARGVLHMPYGLHFNLGAGIMPEPYVAVTNALLQGVGAYGENTAKLVDVALSNALVLDLQFGWDPGSPGGFFFDLGYSLCILGGRDTDIDLVEAATGVDLRFMRLDPEMEVSSRLHNLSLHGGYIFLIDRNWSVTLALGIVKTVAASNKVSFKTDTARNSVAASEIDGYLSDLYLEYGIIPTLSFYAGYRF